MNDDLPEPFEQLAPQPAPPELRSRVLTAVDHELKRRKPRWERVLELSVAASFVLGVGLNVWQYFELPLGTASPARHAEERAIAADPNGQDFEERAMAQRARRMIGPFDAGYAELLVELLDKPSG